MVVSTVLERNPEVVISGSLDLDEVGRIHNRYKVQGILEPEPTRLCALSTVRVLLRTGNI